MSKQFHDSIELKGKHATVMRDGIYLYMPSEIGISDGRDPNIPVQVLRPAGEVEKACNRFKELGKLPLTIRHPDMFLDHADQNVWKNGQGENPELIKMGVVTKIDCIVDIKNNGIKDYEDGTKELSCGWSGEFVKADNGPCEFIQVFHDINHIAIVPAGRCGPMCRINDAIIKEKDNGGKTMTMLDRFLSFLKLKKIEISDDDKKVLEALTDEAYEGKETPKEEEEEKMKDKKKKKKAKDEDMDEPDKTEDEDEEEEENKDKKKKNKDQAVFDQAVKDAYEKGQKEIKDKFLSGMKDVMPIMSEFKASEIQDKTPCEIKSMFIKKITGEDIKDSDPALNAVFKMVMKNYEHPAYRNAFKTEVQDESKASVATQISGLGFSKDAEVK